MRTVLVLLTLLASQPVNGLTIDPDKAGIKTVGGLYVKRITVESADDKGRVTPGDGTRWRTAWATRQGQGEDEVFAQADAAIDKVRKEDARVIVRDGAGRAIQGASVSIAQSGHEFLFGCNIYAFDRLDTEARNEEYKRRFADLFNYATLGFYWRPYEPERGKPNYAYTDKVVAWCMKQGIRMKGYPLDHYATLGKDLHITEFTPTSAGKPITGSHVDGVWDDKAQADYAVRFYLTRSGQNSIEVTLE